MRTTHKTNRSYDTRFREDAIALLHRSNRSCGEIAASLGIPRPTLHNWYKQDMAKKGKKLSPAKGHVVSAANAVAESAEEQVTRLQAENEALKRRVASLEEDREILKKFAAFSVKEST